MTQAIQEPTRTDAAIDTGAAVISAGAFGMFGAVLGHKLGSLGSSGRHNLSGSIGGWTGGVVFAMLSLYASFRSRERHANVVDGLREENSRLHAALSAVSQTASKEALDLPAPKTVVEGAEHQEMLANTPKEMTL